LLCRREIDSGGGGQIEREEKEKGMMEARREVRLSVKAFERCRFDELLD